MLLKRTKQIKKLRLVKQLSTSYELSKTFNLNTFIKIDTAHKRLLSIIKVKTTYNWFGKLLNLFFQPPHLNMALTTKDGKKSIYRTVPILLNKGMIVNSKIDNVNDVKILFDTGSVEKKDIQSIQFDEILRRKAGFNSKIEILEEFYELK